MCPLVKPVLCILLALSAQTAAADVIDLGAKVTQDVHFLGDPYTFVRIPPGAFGEYPVGTSAQLALDAPSCNGPYCVGGLALLVMFDERFSGDLVLPVTLSIRYDEGAVAAFGVPETEILFCRYDANWITAEEAVNIRQSVAVFASNPAPVASRSWGAIKGDLRGRPLGR
jgi:hypothetical protein